MDVICIDEYVVHIYSFDDLKEARYKGVPLTKAYSARVDPALTGSTEKHLHIFKRNNQIATITFAGKGHDGFKGPLPGKVVDALRKKYPGIVMPINNVFESINEFDLDSDEKRLLSMLLKYLNP